MIGTILWCRSASIGSNMRKLFERITGYGQIQGDLPAALSVHAKPRESQRAPKSGGLGKSERLERTGYSEKMGGTLRVGFLLRVGGRL